ncbi:MAG TPA: trimethylamine methyltransferase family protein [Anaerolineales bacterium]
MYPLNANVRPKLDVLGEPLVEQIIAEGMELLVDPGVRVHNSEALALLAEAGAEVDFETQVARIPEPVVRKALESAPAEFDLYDLEGKPAVHYGADQVQFDPGSAGLAVLDHPSGKQRAPLTADFVRWVKLVETLPQIDAQSTSMVCTDVTEEIGDLYRLYLGLCFMRKPIITGAFRKDTWWTMKELLCAAAGGEAALEAKPLAVFDVCPSPPLLWSDLTCQNLIDCAHSGIPAQLVSMPLAGAAAPVTLAASVVQHTAESLSGIAIHQFARAGAPIVWGGSPAAFDMRTGTTPMGAAETWLIDAAYVQMGKALHLPTHVYMGMSDAKVVDVQCGLESMGGALVAALCGANMVSGAGMLDFETCLSFEKLVIDAEIIGLAKRTIAGVTPRENPIALTIMRQMGHHSDYLSHPHTHKWFRKELSFPSEVIDRDSLDTWQQKGSTSSFERAASRIPRLLQTYKPSPLSTDLQAELRLIATRAAQKFGMETLPALPQD